MALASSSRSTALTRVLERGVVLAVLGPEAPLVAEERGQVQVLGDVVERDALGDAGADERRREERVVGGHVGAGRLPLDRRRCPAVRAGCAWARCLLGDLAPEERVVLARLLQLDQAVHGAQALEGVAAVEEPPVVDLAQVPLDVGAGEGGPTQQDREVGQVALVQLDQVLAHDQGRLHQQPAHADGVGLVLLGRRDHLVDADLDAEVDHLVAVVGQDDVDQVLADVVHVALDRGQDDRALAALVRLLHVGLEEGDGRLHRLGRLEHEGQLHLAGGEALAHHLHALEQDVVDDGQGAQCRPRAPRSGRPRGRCGCRR